MTEIRPAWHRRLIIKGKKPQLLSLKCIYQEAENSAFTDLIDFQGCLLCAFRIADCHQDGQNGTIQILQSREGTEWSKLALLQKEGVDLRDPKFSIDPKGQLLLNMGGSTHSGSLKQVSYSSLVSCSTDGKNWSLPQTVWQQGEWIWGLTWFQGIGYGAAYQPNGREKAWVLSLVKTSDGFNYQLVERIQESGFPSEAKLQFLQDGTLVALLRQRGFGSIGRATAPYTSWQWQKIKSALGGPTFLFLRGRPSDQLVGWASSRLLIKKRKRIHYYTALGRLGLKKYEPKLLLPSAGDTGYPGMVYRNKLLYLSYYSSHEGKAKIYLAKIQLPNCF